MMTFWNAGLVAAAAALTTFASPSKAADLYDGYGGSIKDAPMHYASPRGRCYVRDTSSNALWGMQFIWPIKADFRITYLADDYSQTIISRQQRDYVWIMARTPQIPDADYQRLLAIVASHGYDISQVQKVPQSWP